MSPEVLVFGVSLAVVVAGANLFVSAAVALARLLKLPEIIVGATIVSIATTMPEIMVSLFAGLGQHEGVALGNVLGSPLVNMGLLAGIVLVFAHPSEALESHGLGVRRITSLVIVSIGVFGMLLLLKTVGTLEGAVLVGTGAVYLGYILWYTFEDLQTRPWAVGRQLLHSGRGDIAKFVGGGALLLAGAHFLVGSAAALAETLRIPEAFVGLTFIALGTSLPELVTALVSIVRRREQLALGNLAGASLLTLTLAFGVAAFSGTVEVLPELTIVEGPLIVFSSFLLFAATLMPQRRRIFGMALLLSYGFYLAFFALFR